MKPSIFLCEALRVFALVALGMGFGTSARAVDFLDGAASEELRLHLSDPAQERRTTSLNWVDLVGQPAAKKEGTQGTLPPGFVKPRVRIVIDPGHGGRDLGAKAITGTFEKNLCLRIARLVKVQLEKQGKSRGQPIEVQLTRETDQFLSLPERARIANDWGADLFVSIHGNSADVAAARGFEVYFLSTEATDRAAKKLARLENAGQQTRLRADVLSILSDVEANYHINESSRFAESVFRSLSQRLKPNGRGVRQAPFAVLSGTAMPALLVEVGYLTHQEEARKLTKPSYLKRLASAISTGIMEFAVRLEEPARREASAGAPTRS